MKKVLFLSLLIAVLSLVSCNQTDTKETTTTVVKNTTTTITEPCTEGFLLKKQVVVHGNTVWGFTQKVYGTGTNWRDVVAQNPFLQQPGRVYYDDAKKMWIVLIYPGEVLRLGGEIINPTYVVEETTTTTTVSKPASTTMPWWGWALIVALVGLLLIGLCGLFWPRFMSGSSSSSNSNSSSSLHVNIDQPGYIDIAVQRAILENKQALRQGIADTIINGAKNGNLKDFHLVESEEVFIASGSFRKGAQQTEVKKEEGK